MTDPRETADLALRVKTLEQELSKMKKSRGSSRRRTVRWIGLSALALILAATAALATPAPVDVKSCPGGDLFCFDANTPAKSKEVNHNFAQLLSWLQEKVGTVGSNNVAVTGNLGVDGALTLDGALTMTADPATINGAVDVRGPVTMYQGFQTRAFSTPYTAGTDGLVIAYGYMTTSGGHIRLVGQVGDATMARSAVRNEAGDTGTSITFPVRRGDNYRVNSVGGTDLFMYFVPLGRSQSN